jgi:hypothetical protein
MTEEDEAFNDIERQAKQRMEAVRIAVEKHMKNQQAFPNPNNTSQTGMTLRDYFAAKAMQGFLLDKRVSMQNTAIDAYKMADAMLKAREV